MKIIFLPFFLHLTVQTCFTQSIGFDASIKIDSITCKLEEGGVTNGHTSPDELYCLITIPSGETKRTDLGQWGFNDFKKMNELLLTGNLEIGTSVAIEFWECDNSACGEYGVDDFMGSIKLEINNNTKPEWISISYSKIIKIRTNKSALINLIGSKASYLVVLSCEKK